jgi:hypothetical protein
MSDRRLIEESFPLKEASEHSKHEKNVRHGHISTLHIWPARRALAAPVVEQPASVAPQQPASQQPCDPSYPDFCLEPGVPDLDCGDIAQRRFTVRAPDPHGFDGNDNDGIGCESS